MKKILAILLSTMLVATMLTACGDKKGSGSGSEDKTFKIGLVTDSGGVNDNSFNQSAWEGLQRAEKDLGVEVKYIESKTDSDYAPNIDSFVDEDYDLIIGVGYMLADALKTAAEANPDKQFAIIDDASIDLDNVASLIFKAEQASYLVGYVAGKMTKTNTVGIVIGMANETMHQFGYGYTAGVLDANKDCKVEQFNANSYTDPAVGKADANTAIANGADVVFHAAGGTGLGVIEGCEEANVYAIGVDSDQSSIAPKTVITSAMKRVDNAVYEIVKDLVDGKYKGGIHTYDLKAEGVDIAPTTDLLPEDLVTEIQGVKQDILDGKVTVPDNKADFEAKYGDVYKLDD